MPYIYIRLHMKFRKIIIVSVSTILAALVAVVFFVRLHQVRTVFDEPDNLSPKKETITVHYINWACDCADFVEEKNLSDSVKEDSCIYIEPADSSLKVPEEFYNKGHFTHALKQIGRAHV